MSGGKCSHALRKVHEKRGWDACCTQYSWRLRKLESAIESLRDDIRKRKHNRDNVSVVRLLGTVIELVHDVREGVEE